MVSEDYKKATGWGIVLTFFIGILYIGANIFFNPALFLSPVPNWIFVGPILFLSQCGLFMYLYLISRKELTDDEDKKMIRTNQYVLISSLLGFFIWLFILGILALVHWDINVFMSIFCGFAVIYVVHYGLETAKKNLTH
jgi:peptidoglycan biosynthesis protein MviN/MurJ (putative lipid II flippase)